MTRRQLNDPGLDYEEILAVLEGIALNLRLSWNHSAHAMWRILDPELWDRARNPLVLLQTVSRDRLMQVVQTRSFQESFRDVLLQSQSDGLVRRGADPFSGVVAYFSMEYMLTEALPIYSGGLGNVAGDQLKAASDMDMSVVAVGMLFQQGYFRQEIGPRGEQTALFPFNNPRELPISPVRKANGEWIRLRLERPNYVLWLRVWQAQIGSATLYLLDTNDPANDPTVRLLGGELYGDGPQLRLRQEIILGIGGWKLLREIGLNPPVCHLNEGHAAFAVLERARCYMEDASCDFSTALTATRVGNVFTTHTPVDAGFDRFSPALIESHLRPYVEEHLRIQFNDFLALGRSNPDDSNEPFNMAYLALRGCGAANGVSRMHGIVSRRIFAPLFSRWPEAEIPIGHVTNGVHPATWASAEACALWNDGSAPDGGGLTATAISGQINGQLLARVTDGQLWQLRNAQRAKLIAYARKHLVAQRSAVGGSGDAIGTAAGILEPEILTLVFARRFAEYKRPTLLLHDASRFASILRDNRYPAQLIIAGKSHPADQEGQRMITAWNGFIDEYKLQDRVVFLADYDMHLTQKLVQGADLWINTPRPPWEASGTSGMKVLVNGGLNLSVQDGWWAEAYSSEYGWNVASAGGGGDRDAQDAEQIYSILENDVKPMFYARAEDGLPTAWLSKMRASMTHLTAMFSTHRTVNEYLEQYYRPAADAFARRSTNKSCLAVEIARWQRKVRNGWRYVQIVSRETVHHVGAESCYQVLVRVHLGELTPGDVAVECFADNGGSAPFCALLYLDGAVAGSENTFLYSGTIPADRPDWHYTVRVFPHHPEVKVPLEVQNILWEQ